MLRQCLRVAGSPTFKTVVERVKGVVQGAMSNADIPFHQVMDAVAAARSAAHAPVFQTQLTLEGWSNETKTSDGRTQGRMGDLAIEPVPVRLKVLSFAAPALVRSPVMPAGTYGGLALVKTSA